MPRRQGNNPTRRIQAAAAADPQVLERLRQEVPYTGSGHHKRRPANYRLQPPVSPRASKSLCDYDTRVSLEEAHALFIAGLERAMVSERCIGDRPKYVWAVSPEGRAYEAKLGGTNNAEYHGYELYGHEENMRQYVLHEWMTRCPDC